ncbi:hypothetical protein M3Y96_00002100 [Aphelenchoides besseyi]|nr:hypothetical protein M3Y96_00002100 [Aphelenchoides besseyi]
MFSLNDMCISHSVVAADKSTDLKYKSTEESCREHWKWRDLTAFWFVGFYESAYQVLRMFGLFNNLSYELDLK